MNRKRQQGFIACLGQNSIKLMLSLMLIAGSAMQLIYGLQPKEAADHIHPEIGGVGRLLSLYHLQFQRRLSLGMYFVRLSGAGLPKKTLSLLVL